MFFKTIVSVLALGLYASSWSMPSACPYTDNFSIQAPDGFKIQSTRATGNMKIETQGPVNFTTGCRSKNSLSNGHAIVTIGDEDAYCTMDIKDGPYMMNPQLIDMNCIGNFQFNSMEHPTGSYYYKLIFSRQIG